MNVGVDVENMKKCQEQKTNTEFRIGKHKNPFTTEDCKDRKKHANSRAEANANAKQRSKPLDADTAEEFDRS